MLSESQQLSRGAQRATAAVLLAEDTLTDRQIAAQIGVTDRTLYGWKASPQFQALLKEAQDRLQAEALRYPIARKRNRMQRLNRRWEKGHDVIDARATDTSMQDVPGGQTGLLVRQTKQIGSGPNAMVIDEYAVDTGLLKELRDMEKQAAVEAGDWQEPAIAPMQKLYIGIAIERV